MNARIAAVALVFAASIARAEETNTPAAAGASRFVNEKLGIEFDAQAGWTEARSDAGPKDGSVNFVNAEKHLWLEISRAEHCQKTTKDLASFLVKHVESRLKDVRIEELDFVDLCEKEDGFNLRFSYAGKDGGRFQTQSWIVRQPDSEMTISFGCPAEEFKSAAAFIKESRSRIHIRNFGRETVQRSLDGFARAMQGGSIEKLTDLMDFDAILDAETDGEFSKATDEEKSLLREVAAEGLRAGFAGKDSKSPAEIKVSFEDVKENGDEASAKMVVKQADGGTGTLGLTLRKSGFGWRITNLKE